MNCSSPSTGRTRLAGRAGSRWSTRASGSRFEAPCTMKRTAPAAVLTGNVRVRGAGRARGGGGRDDRLRLLEGGAAREERGGVPVLAQSQVDQIEPGAAGRIRRNP